LWSWTGWWGARVLEPFDHQNLNTWRVFGERVPTTENLLLEIRKRLERALPRRLDGWRYGWKRRRITFLNIGMKIARSV